MNVAGIILALSDTGGSTGRLRFPLINSTKDWDTLQRRTLEAARSSGVDQCTALLTVLVAALDGSVGQERSTLLTILKTTCQAIREKWDLDQVELSASAIGAYAAASERTSPMEPMPALERTWQASLDCLRRQVEDIYCDFLFEYEALDEFLSVVEEIRNSEPRLLRRLKFPEDLEGDLEALFSRVDQTLKCDRSYTAEKDGYDSEAHASFSLAASLKRLQEAVPNTEEAAKPRITSLTLNANRCREKYQEFEAEEAEQNDYSAMQQERRLRSSEPFDVDSVFVDL